MDAVKLGVDRSFGEFLFGVSPNKLTILNKNEQLISFPGSQDVAGELLATDSVFEKMKKLKVIATIACVNIVNKAVEPENQQTYVNSSKTSVKYLKEIYYSRSLPVRIFMRIFGIIALRSIFVGIKNKVKTAIKDHQKSINKTVDSDLIVEKPKRIAPIIAADTKIFTQRLYDEKGLKADLDATPANDEPETPVVKEEYEQKKIETSYNRRYRKGIALSGSGSNPLTTSSHRDEMFPG